MRWRNLVVFVLSATFALATAADIGAEQADLTILGMTEDYLGPLAAAGAVLSLAEEMPAGLYYGIPDTWFGSGVLVSHLNGNDRRDLAVSANFLMLPGEGGLVRGAAHIFLDQLASDPPPLDDDTTPIDDDTSPIDDDNNDDQDRVDDDDTRDDTDDDDTTAAVGDDNDDDDNDSGCGN
ncbi:MAG: hypothetical protein P9L99_21510 [Candidatus Lernaella stagnicola]|nr:hypothetical protein [Candidatus Lernaella stagnicola]